MRKIISIYTLLGIQFKEKDLIIFQKISKLFPLIQDVSKHLKIFKNILDYLKISHTNSRHFKILQGIFLGQVFYSIMNVQRMKGGCSWLNSIHYDVVDVGDDVGDGIHESHNCTTLIQLKVQVLGYKLCEVLTFNLIHNTYA